LLIGLLNTVVWSLALKCGCFFLTGFCDGHLLVYSETHVDVFNCASGEWVQTINVKRAKPLNSTGTLSMCVINDMPHIIYLSNVHQRKLLTYNILRCDAVSFGRRTKLPTTCIFNLNKIYILAVILCRIFCLPVSYLKV
jgi:hypothetical protein